MEQIVSTLFGVFWITSPVVKTCVPLLTNAVLAGHFREDFEKYTAGLENSQVYTLEELVEFNRKHSEKELPPR